MHKIDGKPYWHHYLEIGGELMPMDDLETWTLVHYAADNQVALTTLEDGETMVSTVFLGLNHSPEPGPPLIYETMICGPAGCVQPGGEYFRYYTREEALEGHVKVVEDLVRKS